MNFKIDLYKKSLANSNCKAIVDLDSDYTYGELLSISKGFINLFDEDERVGLFFEKCADYLISVYSMILTDNSFIPLEKSLPKERLKYIIKNSDLKTIVTKKENEKFLRSLDLGLDLIFIEDIKKHKKYNKKHNLEVVDGQSAYIIYTSGSTGTPKGVNVSYDGILNVINQQIKIFNMNKSNFYLYLSISFDASLSDIFCSFLSSSTIFINDDLRKNILKLVSFFNDKNITHTDLPPSILKITKPSMFDTLKTIVIGGEVADYKTVQEFSKKIKLVNVYGPTEATICTSYKVCDSSWNKSYIGKPLDGVQYVLIPDDSGFDQLAIQGCQLALGYINNDVLNSKSFKIINGVKTYLTGDLVKTNSDNELEFIGRIDRQIKINGQLVNLQEVENQIKGLEKIENVAVFEKNGKIYSCFEGDIEPCNVREYLKDILPQYMIPSFIFKDSIDKTLTDKNDTKNLKIKDFTNFEILEIKKIFSEILEIDESFSVHDSFIHDLGGDSISFITLHLELTNIGFNIDYDYLIENNSVADILSFRENKLSIDTDFLINEYDDLEIPENIRFVKTSKPKNVLVTGATGFLGTKLIENIQDDVDYIYCLVRGDNPREKLFKSFKNNKIKIKDESKIILVSGDVSKEFLGLDNANYEELSNITDTVYHCAAEVNNIKTYNMLYDSNVLSTVNVTKFLFNGKPKKMHYASTLSVFVSSDNIDKGYILELPLKDDNKILYSGYSQTKWLSEYYLSKVNELSNAISIYRFGLLTNDTKTNNYPNNSFFNNFFDDISKIGEYPYDKNIEISMDITPIDIAANKMSSLSFIESNGIYHITLNKNLSLNMIGDYLNLKRVDSEYWFNSYSNTIVAQNMTELSNFYIKKHNMNLFETTYVDSFHNSKMKDIEFDFEGYLKDNIFYKF